MIAPYPSDWRTVPLKSRIHLITISSGVLFTGKRDTMNFVFPAANWETRALDVPSPKVWIKIPDFELTHTEAELHSLGRSLLSVSSLGSSPSSYSTLWCAILSGLISCLVAASRLTIHKSWDFLYITTTEEVYSSGTLREVGEHRERRRTVILRGNAELKFNATTT